jgi:DNA-binding transcriptional LysR family regulator
MRTKIEHTKIGACCDGHGRVLDPFRIVRTPGARGAPGRGRNAAGLAYTFEHFVSDHIEAGRLVRVLDSWCPPLPGYHLYYPSRRKSAALAAFAETLREKSREQRF